jgi:sporulation protein YlmC with PRC-barrel domain
VRREARVELLIGKRVLDREGKPVGRIEELRAERRGRELVVTEYLVGAYGLLERLSALRIGRYFLRAVAPSRSIEEQVIPWDRLDLTDPARPRLR